MNGKSAKVAVRKAPLETLDSFVPGAKAWGPRVDTPPDKAPHLVVNDAAFRAVDRVDSPERPEKDPKGIARACVAEVTRTVGRAAWVVVDDSGIVAHESEADARRSFNRAKIAEEPKPVYLYRVEQVGATFSSLDKRKR